jgi:hypothetical protein
MTVIYSHNVRVWYSFYELIFKKENTKNSESRLMDNSCTRPIFRR